MELNDYGHWIPLTEREGRADGFIYAVFCNANGRQYIGRKNLISMSSKLPPGKTRRVKSYKESDWKRYKTSCKDIHEDIELYGIEQFTFVIIEWVTGKGNLTYKEVQYQWENEVLSRVTVEGSDERLWYNGQIGAVKFLKPK